ncbi:MAG: methyl-accepting chemotaxis protein [Desulfocapsaceae bacterium]|nr:methyl-accepting chemotaxis protein [Desulfocapsaceae bacterium]
MSIRRKILLTTLPFFLLFGLISMGICIRALQNEGSQSIDRVHSIMVNDKNEKLNDLVRNTFEIMATQYRAAHDPAQVAQAYKQELQSVVDLAYSSIEDVYAKKDLTDAEKQKMAAAIVEKMRYADGNYLWINDMQPVMVMHPIKPELDGKNVSDARDPNGTRLFVEMVKVCQKDGQGFVEYMWPKPGEEKPVAKLSYVRLFKPWNWIIGTGVYMQAAEERFMDEAKRQIGSLRFGPDNQDYFFIIDTGARIVMHPIKPELDGKDMSDFQDPQGKKFFAEMARLGKENGDGYIEYMWPKPGEKDPVRKISYVRLFKQWNWIVGTGIYADDIDKALLAQQRGMQASITRQGVWIAGCSAVLIAVVGCIVTFLANRISSPIRSASLMLRDIAEGEGDLTRRLKVSSGDELGDLAKWFNVFVEKLQNIIKDIADDGKALNTSVDSLSRIAGEMSKGAEETSGRANTVSAAVEEMSANMSSVASSMGETTANVDMVAAAVEEMNATIKEIAQTSEKARVITDQAVGEAARSSAQVDALGKSAQEIAKVLETISDISDQVDLLALNATIEAARAGDAGKGFAVVASEIKELARQTAAATNVIRDLIEEIQKTTRDTIVEIGSISKVVSQNSSIVNTIATAVEEQAVTVDQISQNISHISQGIQEINENVSQSSSVSIQIAGDIADVNRAAQEMSENSNKVNTNTGSLHELSAGLTKLVGTFKV